MIRDLISVSALIAFCVIAGLMVFWIRHLRVSRRSRYRRLTAARLTASPESLHSSEVHALVDVDFGYGKEIWACQDSDPHIEHPADTVDNAKLVLPRPSRRLLCELCRDLGCELHNIVITY